MDAPKSASVRAARTDRREPKGTRLILQELIQTALLLHARLLSSSCNQGLTGSSSVLSLR